MNQDRTDQHPVPGTPTDEEEACDPGNLRSHQWKIWTLHFLKCLRCGEYTARESYPRKMREIEEGERREAQLGR